MQFTLHSAVSGAGNQIGSTITNNSVAVANGIFTVNLDFGAGSFPGADRWLEIGVRKAADPPGFTILTPRQQVTSSPYSIKTMNASSADSLSAACAGCVSDGNISGISGAKVSGSVASATVAGSATTATTAGNVTGTVAIANGGTGSTNASGARSNLGLGTLATMSPGGTANGTTFLRGDNSWASVSGASVMTASSVNPTGLTFYIPTTGHTGSGTAFTYANIAMTAPIAFTLDNLRINFISTGGSGTTSITVTLYKNDTATALSCSTTTVAGGTATCSNTADSVTFAPGDTFAFFGSQGSSSPIVRISTGMRVR
jgi:hypothetical protein